MNCHSVLRLRWWLGIGVTLALWSLPILCFAHQPSLLAKARRVKNPTHSHRLNLTLLWAGQGESYRWISNHELLTTSLSSTDSTSPCRWWRYDFTTGTRTPLTQLSTLFDATTTTPTSSELSPDGQWLLWPGTEQGNATGTSTENFWYAATLDGIQQVRWLRFGDEARWTTNSRCWIEYSDRDIMLTFGWQNDSPLTLHSVEDPLYIQRIYPKRTGLLGAKEAWCVLPDGSTLLSTTATWHGIPAYSLFADTSDDGILNIPFTIERQPLFRYPVPLPPGAYVTQVAFAPEGDRIAWKLAQPQKRGVTVSLWMSKVDGLELHQLGEVKTKAGPLTNLMPADIRWLPDGTKLSFIYKKSLYILPVN